MLFEPDFNLINPTLMKKQYSKLINEKNLSILKYSKIKKILKNESLEDKEHFLRYLIYFWFNDEYKNNLKDNMVNKVKKMFKKLELNFSEKDKHDLDLVDERIFSKNRHIKILEVNSILKSKENVGVKFINAQIYNKVNLLFFWLEGDLMISNERIIFISNNQLHNFYWKDITFFSFEKYGFDFWWKNKNFVLRIHDQETLNNTLKNIISKKVIKDLPKLKKLIN